MSVRPRSPTLRELQARPPLAQLQVLFVTVDPEHDTPAVLSRYLAAFNPDFIGLRAAPGALAPLLRNLSAYLTARPAPGAQGSFDHSSTLYLLDSRARLAAVFTPPFSAAAMRADLQALAQAGML